MNALDTVIARARAAREAEARKAAAEAKKAVHRAALAQKAANVAAKHAATAAQKYQSAVTARKPNATLNKLSIAATKAGVRAQDLASKAAAAATAAAALSAALPPPSPEATVAEKLADLSLGEIDALNDERQAHDMSPATFLATVDEYVTLSGASLGGGDVRAFADTAAADQSGETAQKKTVGGIILVAGAAAIGVLVWLFFKRRHK